MRNLTAVFGDKPRVRLLEAMLSLAPHSFTRGEAAQEAGLRRASANRVFPELEGLGLVRVEEQGAQPVYRVDRENEVFRILQVLDHALELALDEDERSMEDLPSTRFRKAVSGHAR